VGKDGFCPKSKEARGTFSSLFFSQASKAAGLFLGPNRRRARPAGSGPTEFPRARWCPSRRRTEARPTPWMCLGVAALIHHVCARARCDATLQRRLSVSSRPLPVYHPVAVCLAPPAPVGSRRSRAGGCRCLCGLPAKGNAVASWFRPRRLPGGRCHGDVTRHQTDAHWTFLHVFEYDDPRLLQCKKNTEMPFLLKKILIKVSSP